MKGIYYIEIILLLVGCSSSIEKQLASDPTIAAVFDKSEIKDLAVIVDFFNRHICVTHKNDVEKCYECFFDKMIACAKAGNIDLGILVQEKQKFFSLITETKFSSVWGINRTRYPTIQGDADSIEIKSIYLRGKYVTFLKEFGKDNAIVAQYFDSFSRVGDISPICCSIILNESKHLNMKDIRSQFFIAMHYLTEDFNGEEVQKRMRNVTYKDFIETILKE